MNKKNKQCSNCGATFEATFKRQKYCSEACKAIATAQQKSNYYDRVYGSNIDTYINEGIYIQEATRKLEPLENDIKDTLILLSDFGINIDKKQIPNFNTFIELNNWKNDYISKALS